MFIGWPNVSLLFEVLMWKMRVEVSIPIDHSLNLSKDMAFVAMLRGSENRV